MVHIHAEGPAFFAWLPKMFGKRVVVTVHSKELDAYAESVKYFREENDGKLPSLKSLKKRKEELTKEIAERKKAYCGRLQTGQGHEE